MRISLGWKSVIVAAVALVVVVAGLWQGMESYTARSEFCGGSCHVMTEQFEAWKASRHHASHGGKQAECIDCHFEPGGKKTLKAKFVGLRHLAAYLADPKAHLPVKAKIPDGACLSCHDKNELRDKPIKYLDKVTFKHGPHFDGKLDGQQVFCDTCHVKETQAKHFEVPQRTCFTCHFTPGRETTAVATAAAQPASPRMTPAPRLNQGRGKCETCHEIPTKSLQAQLSGDDPDREPITHQTLIAKQVACESCHKGVVEGTGAIQTAGCFAECHNRSDDLLAKAADGPLMHQRHIAGQRAECDDCHAPITHKKPADYLEATRAECGACHQDAHEYQRILLAGASVADGVPATPHLMDKVSTNCLGCHLEDKTARGHKVKTGSVEGCVACHGPKHRNVVQEWKDLLTKETKSLQNLALEAEALLAKGEETRAGAEPVVEARQLVERGRRLADVIVFGNGVHNKKYAMMIMDEAFASFDDAIALLEAE